MNSVKNSLIIVFVAIFIVTLTFPTFTIINFYLNQSKIEAEKCVNKSKPELNCKGHCYLEKELNIQKDNSTDQENTRLEVSFLNIYFVQNIKQLNIKGFDFSINLISKFNYINLYSYLANIDLLDPPQV